MLHLLISSRKENSFIMISSRRKIAKELPESSRLYFLEVFSKHFRFIKCSTEHPQAVE